MPHPLETKMQIKIQTKNTSTPQLALLDAINALKQVCAFKNGISAS
jgi:DNA-directed RNA polymerase subunit L